MALGVEGMRAGKVVRKVIFLTLGTAIFIFCLTALYESMRAVMDVGGACASGGAYEIRQACPKGVGWVIPVSIFGMFAAGIFTFLGVFDEGGPRPYVFAWSALFLALGWNFLDYGFNPPDNHDTVWGWVICGIVFVVMGGAPLLLLFSPRIARWSIWGPDSQRADDYLHPYKPPPIRGRRLVEPAPDAPVDATTTVHSSTPYPALVGRHRTRVHARAEPAAEGSLRAATGEDAPEAHRRIPTEGRRRRTPRHAGRPAASGACSTTTSTRRPRTRSSVRRRHEHAVARHPAAAPSRRDRSRDRARCRVLERRVMSRCVGGRPR